MQTEDYDIVGSYNNQRVKSIDAERSVNLFEYIDPLGKKAKSLLSTSGLVDSEVVFIGATGGFRAQFVFQDKMYVVIGTDIYLINNAFVSSKLNSQPLGSSTGYVGIDANTFQVIFVDGQSGYIWDTLASTFTKIIDSSFPVLPLDVCYLDGFFVVANGSTNNFQLSMFNQGLIWGAAANNFTTVFAVNNTNFIIGASTIGGSTGSFNYETGVPVTFSNSGGALPTTTPAINNTDTFYTIHIPNDNVNIKIATSYANAIAGTAVVISNDGSGTNTITSLGQLQQGAITSHPGTIVACRTLHRRLFLFSQFFTEVWENAGLTSNLPFRRNNSLLMEYGTPTIGSIAVGFDKMFFLSQDRDGLGSVMEVVGTQSVPVSNRALDFQLAQYAEAQHITDCRAFLIKENGLIFYRMNFTLANHTFVYNVSFSNPSSEETLFWHEEEVLNGDRHPAQTHGYFLGTNYVGNFALPILYETDSDISTNDGEAIRRMRIARPFVPPGYQRLRVDRFQLDLLQGQISQSGVIFSPPLNLLTETVLEILTETSDNITTEMGLEPITNPMQPEVFLSLSKDGGQTFGYLMKAPMGEVGQRSYRTVWRKLGTVPRGQAFVPKIEFFNEMPFIVLGASWAMEILPE